jgi:hypothetical protein
VEDEISAGHSPNVYVLTGSEAWTRASRRREVHGAGSALVLPQGGDPRAFRWPVLDSVFVDARTLRRQAAVELGAALIANGVRYAAVLAADDEALNFRAAA